MLTAYALLSSDNRIQSTIFKDLESAERALSSEFPPGHVIYPDHKVVEIRIEIVG